MEGLRWSGPILFWSIDPWDLFCFERCASKLQTSSSEHETFPSENWVLVVSGLNTPYLAKMARRFAALDAKVLGCRVMQRTKFCFQLGIPSCQKLCGLFQLWPLTTTIKGHEMQFGPNWVDELPRISMAIRLFNSERMPICFRVSISQNHSWEQANFPKDV